MRSLVYITLLALMTYRQQSERKNDHPIFKDVTTPVSAGQRSFELAHNLWVFECLDKKYFSV